MIKSIVSKIVKGRMYATITRDSIVEGEYITIKPSLSSDASYKKYLPNEGLVVDIDITPYCDSAITGCIKDVYDSISHEETKDAQDFHTACSPVVNGRSLYMVYYPNIRATDNRLLTKLPFLQVSEDAGAYTLLLAFHASDDARLKIEYDGGSLQVAGFGVETLVYLSINTESAPQFLEVQDLNDISTATFPIRTVPSGMNTRRLVWLNEVGGIDSWSFEFLRESSFATSSEVFYSSTRGYTRTNRISERAHIVETRELDDITASVVAYVIASPQVYLEENGALTPIDIVTEECRTYSDTELSSIQVAYRLKERERV